MKKILFFMLMLALLPINIANAEDEKIDPATYVCAEFVASTIDGNPPIFEGLQLDGYAAAQDGIDVADPENLQALILGVIDSCTPKPAEKALKHWRDLRKQYPYMENGEWRANKTTCGDYAANPDDGSGFVIWLDAYNRGKTGKGLSVFESQETLDHFLEACKKSPQRLMIDVLKENAK